VVISPNVAVEPQIRLAENDAKKDPLILTESEKSRVEDRSKRRQGGLHADVDDSPGWGADFEVRDLWDAMRKLGFPSPR
jgi:hypothetical protein